MASVFNQNLFQLVKKIKRLLLLAGASFCFLFLKSKVSRQIPLQSSHPFIQGGA